MLVGEASRGWVRPARVRTREFWTEGEGEVSEDEGEWWL